MSRPRRNLRLFVGVYPPPEVAREMIAALNRLDLPDRRTTPLEQVHLTLQFVGDTPAADLERVIESVERAASGLTQPALTPEALITLPERGPKRLIAVRTDADATLLELQRRLASRLAHNPRVRPGDRFLPHLTVCRFRSPTRMDPIEQPLDLSSFSVEQVRLMRSTLNPAGAQHHEVAAFELQPGPTS